MQDTKKFDIKKAIIMLIFIIIIISIYFIVVKKPFNNGYYNNIEWNTSIEDVMNTDKGWLFTLEADDEVTFLRGSTTEQNYINYTFIDNKLKSVELIIPDDSQKNYNSLKTEYNSSFGEPIYDSITPHWETKNSIIELNNSESMGITYVVYSLPEYFPEVIGSPGIKGARVAAILSTIREKSEYGE